MTKKIPYRRPISSIGRASDYCAGGIGFNSQTQAGPTLRVSKLLRSTPASLSFKGQATKHTIVKCSTVSSIDKIKTHLILHFNSLFVVETWRQAVSLEIPCHADASGSDKSSLGIQVRSVHFLWIHVRAVFIRQFVRSMVGFDYRVKNLGEQGIGLFISGIYTIRRVELFNTWDDLVPESTAASRLLNFELVKNILCQELLQERFHFRPFKCLWKFVLFLTGNTTCNNH